MLILPRVHGDVAIEVMGVSRGSKRGRGGEDDASSGGSGPTTPFVLKNTDCRVSSLSLEAGQMLMLEVLLCASYVITLSSKSAAPVTAPVDDGVQSATASVTR